MRIVILLSALLLNGLLADAQLKPGYAVPDIQLPDTNDSIRTLSSLKGKVILIDFWASWCRPCRASNPAIVRLYKKYAAKGFEVFAVSIDSKKESWLKAIKADRLPYLQVNDNAGWSSKTAEAYSVDQIPSNFLLNKQGKLIGIDLEGAGLERAIKALLESK